MRVFVTGGTGFVGKPTLRRLVEDGHEVRCLVRRTSNTSEIESLGCKIAYGDVTDKPSVVEGMRDGDWPVHLANIYSFWEPAKNVYRRINVEGTRNVMEAALKEGISKVVHVSTFLVWGKPKQRPFNEETPMGPVRFTEYAQSKYEGDEIVWGLFRERGVPVVVLYPGGVLGAGTPKSNGQFIRNLIERRMPGRAFEDSAFTWVHVKDVAEAIVRALEKEDILGAKYLIGKHALTMGELTRMVCELSGAPVPKRRGSRPAHASGSCAPDEGVRPEREATPLGDVHGRDEERKGGRCLRREQGREGIGRNLHPYPPRYRGGGRFPPKISPHMGKYHITRGGGR